MSALAHRYRVTGTLIPLCDWVLAPHPLDTGLIAGHPIAVDIVIVSTDPSFPARTAGWEITLGYAAWRWERPPLITRLEQL